MNSLKNALGVNEGSPEEIEARRKAIAKTLVIAHSSIWLLVNLLLFIINISINYDYQWHMWPLACWGAVLAFHISLYNIDPTTPAPSYRMIIHSSIFTIVSWLLIFIDNFTSPKEQVFTWFWWPVGIWALILALHYIAYSSLQRVRKTAPAAPAPVVNSP
eukprot:TRINITY_DN4213_c0_g1_i4.p1 TRINITY_DN4213_c0_g1~~TRINITY_DN4213_c0_g1_i4.p1  ORF type:complete len:160 (+),score=14.93 TRINITY_DN4213_c0_g1_i4:269-748(+)